MKGGSRMSQVRRSCVAILASLFTVFVAPATRAEQSAGGGHGGGGTGHCGTLQNIIREGSGGYEYQHSGPGGHPAGGWALYSTVPNRHDANERDWYGGLAEDWSNHSLCSVP